MSNISVVGIGKLGFPLVVCLASKGYRVIGVDVDPKIVASVNERKPLIYEPHLVELLERSRDISACSFRLLENF